MSDILTSSTHVMCEVGISWKQAKTDRLLVMSVKTYVQFSDNSIYDDCIFTWDQLEKALNVLRKGSWKLFGLQEYSGIRQFIFIPALSNESSGILSLPPSVRPFMTTHILVM